MNDDNTEVKKSFDSIVNNGRQMGIMDCIEILRKLAQEAQDQGKISDAVLIMGCAELLFKLIPKDEEFAPEERSTAI